jgi:uncharacterized protein (TIGR02145 family)
MICKQLNFLAFLLVCMGTAFTGCKKEADNDLPEEGGYEIPNVPAATAIDADFVGTWYPTITMDHPLSENWEAKTFVGSEGFEDYRTMVFTADGKNAVEYIANLASGVGYFYKYVGNLVQEGSTLRFYPTHAFLRIHRNGAITTDRRMTKSDFANSPSFYSVLTNCQVNSHDGVTTLTGRRDIDVSYRKVAGSGNGGGGGTPGGIYSTPPATGTHVKIGAQYYPTVTIGNQEWMAVNYAGPSPLADGSVKGYAVPEDGKYYSWRDAVAVASSSSVPTGWRLPTRQDFITLLASQGVAINDLGYTATVEFNDGTSGAQKLYKLLANARWTARADNGGSASVNASGFTAIPADFKNTLGGGMNGYNANCYLWSGTPYADNTSQAWNFGIRRFTNSITANLDPINKGGSSVILYPFRLVRDK